MVDECRLIEDSYGWLVQGLLGVLAILALVLKRHLEIPQRTFVTFFRDVSKQGFGSLIAHVANIMLALQLKRWGNECKWYFINYVIDNLVGILLNYLVLKLFEWSITKCAGTDDFKTGQYGEEDAPGARPWRAWFLQMLVWTFIVTANKALIFFLIILPLKSPLFQIGDFLIAPLDPVPKAELVFVMILVPGALNVLQFWVQDSMLKHEPTVAYRQSLTGDEDIDDETKSLINENRDGDSEVPPPSDPQKID